MTNDPNAICQHANCRKPLAEHWGDNCKVKFGQTFAAVAPPSAPPEQTKPMQIDEFAPHWSALLNDGTLTVTFEIETTLTDIPDAPLLELLRESVIAQRGEAVAIRLIVSGQEHRATYATNATIRTVIAQAIDATFNVGRKAADWELRDADGRLIDHGITLGAALANFPNSDPLWLSPCAGWGS